MWRKKKKKHVEQSFPKRRLVGVGPFKLCTFTLYINCFPQVKVISTLEIVFSVPGHHVKHIPPDFHILSLPFIYFLK